MSVTYLPRLMVRGSGAPHARQTLGSPRVRSSVAVVMEDEYVREADWMAPRVIMRRRASMVCVSSGMDVTRKSMCEIPDRIVSLNSRGFEQVCTAFRHTLSRVDIMRCCVGEDPL